MLLHFMSAGSPECALNNATQKAKQNSLYSFKNRKNKRDQQLPDKIHNQKQHHNNCFTAAGKHDPVEL